MDSPFCESCVHFTQHYYLDDQYGAVLNCGHCSYSQIKHHKPRAPACGHYTARKVDPKLPDRDGVIRFLTTKTLQHILNLTLPPRFGK